MYESMNPGLVFWPIKYSKLSIFYGLSIPLLISLFYQQYFIPNQLYIIGSIVIITFFLALPYYETKWQNINKKNFEHRLFWTSFLFRSIYILYLYLLTYFNQPDNFPFELNAADSLTYHDVADKIKNLPFSEFLSQLNIYMKNRADFGYPIYQALIYKIFGTFTLPVRILNALWGSFTVLLLSRIARFLFTEKHARITGIIAMLFPSLLWYGAIQLKETLMIFIIVFIFYNSLKIYFTKRKILKSTFYIIILSGILFYFRTFLAVIVISSYLLFLLLNSKSKRTIIINIISGFIFLFSLWFLSINTDVYQDVENQYTESEGFMERNLSYAKENLGNIEYTTAAVAPLIFTGAFFTPFPSFLLTEERQFPIIAHYQNEIIKNIMYFFGFLGLIFVFKKEFFRKTIMLSYFVVCYLFVLTFTANSFIDRFQLVNVPFIIIFMSVGLINIKPKWINLFPYYFIALLIMHISWVLFKVNIRVI